MTLHERTHAVSPRLLTIRISWVHSMFCGSVRNGWRGSEELRTLACDERFFQNLTRGRRCERQLQSGDLQGHSRSIGANATKRCSEDVDSNRLSKGQKRAPKSAVRRMTKCGCEAAEFRID